MKQKIQIKKNEESKLVRTSNSKNRIERRYE